MNIQIRRSKDDILEFNITDNNLLEHFSNRDHCTEFIINQINNERIYDSLLTGEENLTIFDIGANIGIFSVHASDCAKRIFAVEPTPSHFKKLCTLTENLRDVITPLNIALSNTDGEIDFYVSHDNPTQNSLISNWRSSNEQKISVQSCRLLSIFKEQNVDHVDLVKCDIEGGEMFALTTDSVAEVKDIVDNWFVELHQTDNTIGHAESIAKNQKILKEVFEANGYNVQIIAFDTIYCYKE